MTSKFKIDEKLLKLLACPKYKEELTEATVELVNQLRDKQKQGELTNSSNVLIKDYIQTALVPINNKDIAYLVIDQIPRLLIEESIDIKNL